MSAAPTATVIVRSMGRPCLGDAIASVVGQRHPSIELLVVDASGGTHPPLPPVSRLQSAQLLCTGKRLNRPAAANVGLQHATGEWIGFLDDDDYLEPTHLQRLIARAGEPDQPTLVYGQLWTLDHLHRVVHDRHHGFNPLILYYYCRTPGMSWILHRTLRDAGHRLDETLDTSEDWEFLLRMLTHARVATVRERTHFYFMEAGTSGTGSGSNRNDGESQQRCRDSVRTRYAGERDRAWRAYFEHLQTATALRAEARMDAAAAIYATALRAHPDEPNALFLLGKLFEDEDRPHAARLLLRDAIYLNGDAAQYHLALGRVCERLDAHEEARDAYASAARFDPSLRATADEALARIARCLPSTSAGAVAPGVEVGRNVRCPCGSGLRFKACHGALHAGVASTTVAQVSDVHERMTSAVVAAQTGDISNARRLYGEVLARDAGNVDALHALALLELDMGDIHGASDRIELALKHAPNDLQIMEDRQRIRMAVHERAEAMRVNGKLAELPYLVPGTASLAPLDRAVDIHVVAAFRDANGSREFAALALARMLAEDAPVTVWSTHAGLAPQFAARGVREIGVGQGNFPQSGAIIFVNVDPLPAVWLDASAASRVVAVHDTNQPAALLDLVVTMHRSTSCPIQLVTPSETFRRRCGVPAASCPLPVDLERFQPSRRCSRRRPFTIGRVSANDHRLFHPQDPALIRQLLDSGSAVRILGGTVLMRNFAPSKPLPGLELLAADAMTAPEFLRDIDCVFYRTSPLHAEAGGDSIAQALATGIPVVCARDVGYSELISHGVDGFVFDRDDDDEALRQLGLLHADVALRERMGRAARAKAEAVFGPSLTRRLRRIYAGADSAADRLRVQPACATA